MSPMTDPSTTRVPPNRATRRSLKRRGGALGAGGVLVAGSAAALLTALAGSAGAAASITVDSNADGTATASHCTDGTAGNCTLRDAAAAAADGDTINFDASISSITLTDGSIMLGAENIIGPGSASLAITTSAPAAYDVFNFSGAGDVTVSGFSLTKNRIKTENQGKFTMNDVSISNSYGNYGGALYANNSSDLVISGSHFENNDSGNGNKGGAIYAVNRGDVTITDTEIIDNNAQTNGQGGGIFVSASSHFHTGNLHIYLFGFHFTFDAIEWQTNHCSFLPKECVLGVAVWEESECCGCAFFHVPVWINCIIATGGVAALFVTF